MPYLSEASTRLEFGAAVGLVGLAIFQMHDLYVKHAPDLPAVRSATHSDIAIRQAILDADILTFGIGVVVGGSICLLTHSYLPIVFTVSAAVLLSFYWRSVLNGEPPYPTTNEVS